VSSTRSVRRILSSRKSSERCRSFLSLPVVVVVTVEVTVVMLSVQLVTVTVWE
jgi:hypothetical protein